VLEIIGAGLGRTGTSSLRRALGMLGWPTFHMVDLFGVPERVSHFIDAEAGRPVDWPAMFDGFTAAVDYPAALYWRQLMAAYPDAKVLLSVRPADAWYRSTRGTIYESGRRRVASGKEATPLQQYVRDAVWNGQFGGRFEEPEHAMAVFEQHNAAVIAAVPPERLLVYEVGSGWEPICAFFGLDVPSEPYPHANSSADFKAKMDS
jgi:hypothetical protein